MHPSESLVSILTFSSNSKSVRFYLIVNVLPLLSATVGAIIFFTFPPRLRITDGGFADVSPVNTSSTLAGAGFKAALFQLSQDFQPTQGNKGKDGAHVWKRIELLYAFSPEKVDEDVAEAISIGRVLSLELKLRSIPLWKQLCQAPPVSNQRLCDPGDSYIAVAYPSSTKIDEESRLKGVVLNTTFDGKAQHLSPNPEILGNVLRDKSSSRLQRWMPRGSLDPTKLKSLRSTFAFNVSKMDVSSGLWDSLLDDVSQIVKSEEFTKHMLISLKIDATRGYEVVTWVTGIVELFVACTVFAFLATIVVTQRLVLSIAAAVVPVVSFASIVVFFDLTDGQREMPVAALLSWAYIVITCTETACAVDWLSQKYEERPVQPGNMYGNMCGKLCWLKGPCIFAAEVIGPHLLVAAMLAWISTCDFRILAAFATHTSIGLLTSSFYSIILCPNAVYIGDALENTTREYQVHFGQSYNETILQKGIRAICTQLPREFGQGRAKWRREAATRLSTGAAVALHTRFVWFGVLVITCVCITAFAALDTWPKFQGSMPPLFEENNEARILWDTMVLYDPLPSVETVLRDELDNILQCSPDGFDSEKCTSRLCDSGSNIKGFNECECYASDAKVGETCEGAAARMFGVHDRLSSQVWADFWTWVVAGMKLDLQYPRTLFGVDLNICYKSWQECVTKSDLGIPLILQDWTSGGIVSQASERGGFTNEFGSTAPLLENACNRFLCFCGDDTCKPEFKTNQLLGPWTPFCTQCPERFEIPSGSRRLSPAAGSDYRVGVHSEGGQILVNIVFGLIKPYKMPSLIRDSGLQFNTSFKLYEEDTQRKIISYCDGTHPDLQVTGKICWLKDFKLWLETKGELYPLPRSKFVQFLPEFIRDYRPKPLRGMDKDVSGNDFIWWDDEGNIKGFYMIFSATMAIQNDLEDTFAAWNSHVEARNKLCRWSFVGTPWVSISIDKMAGEAVQREGLKVWTSMVVVLVLGIFLLTFDPRLALAVMITLILCAAFLIIIAVHVGGRPHFGIIEIFIIVSFTCILASPLARLGVQYAASMRCGGSDCGVMKFFDNPQAQQTVRIPMQQVVFMDRVAKASVATFWVVEPLVGILLTAFPIGVLIMATSLVSHAQVGMSMTCASLVSIPAVAGVCPVLFVLGFAPSTVQNHAVGIVLVNWLENQGFHWMVGFFKDETKSYNADSVSNAKRVLRWPAKQRSLEHYDLSTVISTSSTEESNCTSSMVESKLSLAESRLSLAESKFTEVFGRILGKPAIPEEDFFKICSLEVESATGKPPFHHAVAVHNDVSAHG